jgi:hypothetical protein
VAARAAIRVRIWVMQTIRRRGPQTGSAAEAGQ